jgi:hypothetical protein
MRPRINRLFSGIFTCSSRTLSRILVACFHFMIIRGLLDLVYLNFSVPFEEGPGLQQYIRQRSWLPRPLSVISSKRNSSKRNSSHSQVPASADVLTHPTETSAAQEHVFDQMHQMPPRPQTTTNHTSEKPVVVEASWKMPPRPLTTPVHRGEQPDENPGNDTYDSLNSSAMCDDDTHFQYGIDFVRGDLRTDTYNMSPGSANACCAQCERLKTCTHWTWADNFCWLKNPPIAARAKVCIYFYGREVRSVLTCVDAQAGVISGRVTVNKYVERRLIPVIHKKKVINCTYDNEDKPFFVPLLRNGSTIPKCGSCTSLYVLSCLESFW